MVLPKRVTILITCHSHNFWQTIVLWACLSQRLLIRLTTFQVKRCNNFLARAKSQNSLSLVWEQTVTMISSTPMQMWHGISWSIPVKSTGGGFIILKMADPCAASMAIGCCDRCGQEDAEWWRRGTNSQRAPNGQDTQRPRRALSDQESAQQLRGPDSGQERTEWLRACLESWQMLCAWFPSFIFLAI